MLPAASPFDLRATVRLLQRRPGNRLDRWEDGSWLRLIDRGEGPVLVQVRQVPAGVELQVRHGHPAGDEGALVRRMLGLDVDLAPFRRAAGAVPGLAPLAAALAGMRPPRFASLFEALLGVIPFQQVSLDAGMAVFSRLVERFGPSLDAAGTRFFAAPAPHALAATTPDDLRPLGLSAAKARALVEAARAIASGALDPAALEVLPTPAARERLRRLRGVGPWSAELLLLRGLGRLDAFPPGDVGVARGLGALLGRGPLAATELEALAARFGPQRGMLYFFSLAGQLRARGLA